jgi:GNAT superfamily N-acetyltransferase
MNPPPVLTYLEMSDPAQFRPSRCEAGVALRPLAARTREIRTLTLGVGRQFRWPSQSWSAERWETYLADDEFRHWAADLHGLTIGILSVNTGTLPDVEIDSFGLLPEHHGQGLGSEFLTHAVRHLWDEGARRIWLHTSSHDHPNALRNYLARGFRVTAPAPT